MENRFPTVWRRVTGELQPVSDKLRRLAFLKYSAHCHYHRLAASPACCRLSGFFARLAREELCHLRQLNALYYLLNGERLTLSEPPEAHPAELLTALRESYQRETELAQVFLSCASDAIGVSLRSIAEADAAHAEQLVRQTDRLL